MLKDEMLELSVAQDMAGVTTSGTDSTNTIDFGVDSVYAGANVHSAGYLNVQIVKDITSGQKLTVELQDSGNNGLFNTVMSYTFDTDAKAGTGFSIKLPRTKRYIKLKYKAGAPITAGKVDAFLGQPLTEH